MASGMNSKYYFELILNVINTVVQREMYNITLKIWYNIPSKLTIFTYNKTIIEVLKEIINKNLIK